MSFSNLNDWLAWLERERPVEAIHLGLSHLLPLAKRLGVHEFNCPVVTVAGTNGKGTCVSMLETIAVEAGLKVASYTSPHLLHFTERIRLQGHPISEQTCCRLFQTFIDSMQSIEAERLSYFEWVTLAALSFFKTLSLDLIVLEVGLGGRLDAVNVTHNDISIITNIAFDHQDFLGDTLEKIAREKAGIIKAGTQVIGADLSMPLVIAETANQFNCAYYQIEKDFPLNPIEFKEFVPSLPRHSLAAAIQCCQLLPSAFNIQSVHIVNALKKVKLRGRFERVNAHGDWILDVGHNLAAVQWLVEQLRHYVSNRAPIHVVFGVCADKSWKEMLDYLCGLSDFKFYWYTCNIPTKRGLPAFESYDYLDSKHQIVKNCQSVKHACQTARQQAAEHQQKILVFGSFYTVSEASKYIELEVDPNCREQREV